jgi:hypothetical protein
MTQLAMAPCFYVYARFMNVLVVWIFFSQHTLMTHARIDPPETSKEGMNRIWFMQHL